MESGLAITAIVLGVVLVGLRVAAPGIDRGRAAAGIAFCIVHLATWPLLARIHPDTELHRALEVASFAFLALAAVIAGGMVIFDVGLGRRRFVPRILRDLVHAFAYLVIVIFILSRAGVNLVSLLTGSVVLTAVIGLALQETLGNVMAGLALQMEADLGDGDWVKLDERITGRVREVGWRATSLVTKNGDLVLVPNSVVARALVTNFSRPTPTHRQWVYLRMHFRYPPAQVREVVLGAVRSAPGLRTEPAPECLVWEFKEDSISYAVRYWIDDFQRDDAIDGEVRGRIWYALHRAGMEIPFPSRNVNLTEMNEDRAHRKLDEEYARRMDALARVDVLRGLDGEALYRLTRRMRLAIFGPGETIIRRGDPGDSLYIVRSGSVSVRLDVDGQARQVATLRDGDFFGEMSLMTGEARSATVVADGDVECYVVAKEALQEILAEKPELVSDIGEILSRRQLALSGANAEQGRQRQITQKHELLSRIAAFFGVKTRDQRDRE